MSMFASQWFASTGASAYLLEQSLLGDGTSSYLNRTSSVAGNRKTWTFSCWFKGTPVSSSFLSVEANDANGPQTDIDFQGGGDTNKFEVYGYSASYDFRLLTSSLYRDSSAWYHIVVAMDTTQATAANRTKIYINGTQVTSFGTSDYPTLNYDTGVNALKEHFIMKGPGAGGWVNGAVALPQLIDGAALAPTSFGETDDDGFWNPIEFTGTTTTDNTSVSGTATAESTLTTFYASQAFDGNTSTRWVSSATPAWLEYDRGSGNGVISTSYSMACGPSGTASTADMPKNWTIEGYNGSSWDTLATVTGEAAWSLSETRLYTFTNTTSYEKYRIDVTLQQGGGAEIEIGELIFYASGTGFGTNGGAYDFADTTFFGKNISGTDDQAALSSAAPAATAWLNITGAWTMGSGTASRTTTVNAIRSASVFTGDFSLAVTMASGANAARVGVYAANEDGTFSYASAGAGGGMDSMTNSFYANFGGANFYKGSSTTASVSQTNGAITITRVSGTITINTAGGNHTFSATYTGPMRFVLAGGGATMSFTGIAYTADGQAGTSYFDTGFATTDQLPDVPTNDADEEIGNFTAFDPNRADTQAAVYSEGNRLITSSGDGSGFMPMGMSSGKWYWEVTVTTFGGNYLYVGIGDSDAALSTNAGAAAGCWQYHSDGYESSDGVESGSAWGASYGLNAVIGVAYDADNGFLYLAKDNTFQASGDPTSGATGTGALASGLNSAEKFPILRVQNNTNAASFNMGQTAFTYTPPTNFVALATQNMTAATIPDGSKQFTPVIYTGTGSELAITSLDFTPDFVWIKNRDATDNHMLYDSVRGATKDLHSNTTDAETTTAQTLKSFDSAGFTLGTDVQVNTNTEDYVAWCWKAGGAASSNTDGTITSSVSANTTSGFSIVSYTGNATAGATFGHGLSSAPKFILAKNRDDGVNAWAGYHVSLGGTKRIFLNTTAAPQTDDGNWFDTDPSATVVTLGNGEISNHTGENFIAYCWAEVEGFSKFGSLNTTGGTANNSFVYTGFRPSLVMIKRTDSAGSWFVVDNTRPGYNPNNGLSWNSTNVEFSGASTNVADLLSNGFKVRFDAGTATYLYIAFAEHPFQGGGGVTQARAR